MKDQKSKKIVFIAGIVFFILLPFLRTFATVTPTPATGGSAISADTAGGAYTTLTGPVIAEGATADIKTGTIILNVPSGFVFDTAGTPTVLVTRTAGTGNDTRNINDLPSGSTIAVVTTSTTLSITITAATSNGVRNSLTWQNVRVRPAAGTPLASGNIVKTGTSAITGITNGVTNLGTLTEVAGAKSQLTISTQPSSSATAGVDLAIKPVVRLQDQFGNTVTLDSTSPIAHAAVLSTEDCTGSGSGILTSTPTSGDAVSAGVMTYTAMNYTAAESIKICFSSTGVPSVLSNAITVSPGALDHFVLSSIATQTVGIPFSVTITAKDAYNNTVTAFTGSVDLSTTDGTISPLVSGAFVFGVRTEFVTMGKGGTGKTLTATDHAGTGKTGTSNAFTVNNPVPTTTSISPTSKILGDNAFTLTVNGTNFVSDSVVYFNGSARSTSYINDTQLTASILAGDLAVSTSSALITVANPAPGGGASGAQIFSVLNPVPVITSISPLSRDAGGAEFTITVNGSNFLSGSEVKWNGSPRTTTFASSSVLTAIIPATDIADPGTANVTVTNAAPGGGDSNIKTFTITVPAPPATAFVILDPTDNTVGNNVVVTVEAHDADGNVVTSYQNNVTLITSGSAAGGGLVDIVNGVGTILISDETAETVDLTLSDTQSTGLNVSSTQNVVFAAGPLFQFTLNSPPDSAAGTRVPYTVIRKDQFGNPVTSGTSTVYLYTSAAGGLSGFFDAETLGNTITAATIGSGASSANFWYSEGLAGTFSVTVSDNASAPDGTNGIDDASDAVTISPATTSEFLLSDPGDMTAGTRLGYTVTRKDAFGNLVTAGSDTVYLYSTSVGSTKAFYDAGAAGNVITSLAIPDGSSAANFWYFDDSIGLWTITASDNASAPDGESGIHDGTDDVTVNLIPITATKLIILDPLDSTAGNASLVTIHAVDDAGALDTSFNGTVTLHTTNSSIGGGIVTIVSGIGTANVNDNVAETVDLSLSDTGSTGLNVSSVQNIIFTAGPVTQFTLNDAGDASAGTRLSYTVTRKDQFGNLVTSGITTVYLYTDPSGSLGKFYDAAVGGSIITSVNIQNGESNSPFWYEEGTSGNFTVTASDNNTAPDGVSGIADAEDTLMITPGAIYEFTLSNPGDMTAGTRLGYTVTRKDLYGNLVTSGVQNAYLYSSSPSASDAFFDAALLGNTITFATIPNGASTAAFWYFDDAVGTSTITASDNASSPDGASGVVDAADSIFVGATPIVPTKFVIGPVSDTEVGSSATITVTAEDDGGNIATTYTSEVTLLVTGSAMGGGVVHIENGVGTIAIADNVIETVTLSLDDTALSGLNVASTRMLSFIASVTPSSGSSTGGGGGGGSSVTSPVLSLNFSGSAFPGALVNVLGVPPGGNLLRAVTIGQQNIARNNASFDISLTDPSVRSAFYAINLTDKNNVSGQYKIFSDLPDVAALRNIVFAPTITLLRTSLRKGDMLSASGFTSPGSVIEAEIDGTIVSGATAASASDGAYRLLVGTANLDLGKHTLRVRGVLSGRASEFSLAKSFSLSDLFRPVADLNSDNAVDIRDINIFLTSWLSDKPEVRSKNDLNGDGKTNIQDLSIFVQSLK